MSAIQYIAERGAVRIAADFHWHWSGSVRGRSVGMWAARYSFWPDDTCIVLCARGAIGFARCAREVDNKRGKVIQYDSL